MGTLLAQCLNCVVAPNGVALGALSEIRVGSAEFVRTMSKTGFVAQEVTVSAEMKARIDDGSVLQQNRLDQQQLLKLIHGLPARGSILVRWHRKNTGNLSAQTDESDRIWEYLAGAMAEKESGIQMAAGFEVWE
eukprot:TRINITY_DN18838_c0_g1_i2.p1 TRINITY_DN18838_c0_g1~~TRINITY_DN18838_c0_g1_i2.p1  ORF type:complete len:134 (-),score=30.36 TRINITY_DN18838_c0_g1_i2:43-444(-)